MALPADVYELRMQIAHSRLIRTAQRVFLEQEPPDCIINDPQQIKRVELEWRERYKLEVVLLARVAQQALGYLEQRGLEAAVAGFTSSAITQPALNSLMRTNPYLGELTAHALKNADSFRHLLTLFVQLGEPDS